MHSGKEHGNYFLGFGGLTLWGLLAFRVWCMGWGVFLMFGERRYEVSMSEDH